MQDHVEKVRERAHSIWETEGRPEGHAAEHWSRAQHEIAAERALEVRPAGPAEMRTPPENWSIVDEQSDESFPASDPPGNY